MLKMLHLCNIGYGCAIAINLVVVRVQRQLCYGFVFEKKAKSVTFSICVCGGSESLGKSGFVLTKFTLCTDRERSSLLLEVIVSFYPSLRFVLLCVDEGLFLFFSLINIIQLVCI